LYANAPNLRYKNVGEAEKLKYIAEPPVSGGQDEKSGQ
jgi:hypothetical protein